MGWGIGLGRALLRGRYGVSLCRFDGKWKGEKEGEGFVYTGDEEGRDGSITDKRPDAPRRQSCSCLDQRIFC